MRLLALLLIGCAGKPEGEDTSVSLVGPDLSHTPPTERAVEAGSLTLEVAATDPEGVSEVTVFFRPTGDAYWDSIALSSGDGVAWTASVPDLSAAGIEYYFKGVDGGTNPAYSLLPPEGSEAPYQLPVDPIAEALPWTEDFESTGGEASLYTLGWWTPSEAFDGEPWNLSTSHSSSGSASALHPAGAEEVGELRDWLISPAIDLSTLSQIMVRWREYGAYDAEDTLLHGLYISTGSRNPADGDFVPVVESLGLPPDGSWERSQVVDLSAWAGEPVAYLGWLYVGTAADDWYIDDVEVVALAAELEAELSVSPAPVHPGETATVELLLHNLSPTPALGYSATLSLPEGGGELSEPTVDIPEIDGEGSGSVSFSLELDPELHDNRYLPLQVDVTNGTESWSWPFEMLVGEVSTATVDLTVSEDTEVEILLGAGDPEAPLVELELADELLTAGSYSLPLEITDAWELLPPTPTERWYIIVTSDDSDAIVTAFVIDYGGESIIGATDTAPAGSPITLFLPEPPRPALLSQSPTTTSPGSTTSLSLTLTNEGAETAGPVTGALRSDDPLVVLSGGEALSVDTDTWLRGESHTLSGLGLTLDVAHDQSDPIEFWLDLTDGVDSWSLPISLTAPWPVLRVTTLTIDDSGGDGILDVGERANLEIELTNVGDLSTPAPVDAILSLEPSSTASATITTAVGSFGLIAVGNSRDEDDFELEVDSGSPGDNLDLLLTLSDGARSYTSRFQITLGEPPWQYISAEEDPEGDNLSAYDFDFTSGEFRVVAGEAQLRLHSAIPYDPDTLFIESWGQSSGGAYLFYRWVLQSGVGSLQGYTDGVGFNTIGDMEVDFIDEDSLVLRWQVSDMDLVLNSLRFGLAAGWCGPSEYYCDHYPDGWGYPYEGYSNADWFSVEW